jgi:hypothetical protein
MERFNNQFSSWGKVFDSKVVSGERTVYSDPVPLGATGTVGVWGLATSVVGTPKVRLFYQVSWDDTLTNFVTPEDTVNLITLSGEVPFSKGFTVPPMPWLRLGAQGMVGNPNDTILTEVIFNV